jgi:hypothetical protein
LPANAGVGAVKDGTLFSPSDTPKETVYVPADDGAVQTIPIAVAAEPAAIVTVLKFSEYVADPPTGVAKEPLEAVNAAAVDT